MTAILRVRQNMRVRPMMTPTPPTPGQAYVDRLMKLVPAEVIALYLAGKSMLLASQTGKADPVPDPAQTPWWIGWTLFCLLATIAIRAWATSDQKEQIPVEWPAVFIASISFLIWVYSMGDAFALIKIWIPAFAGLLVIGWTFIVPLFYHD